MHRIKGYAAIFDGAARLRFGLAKPKPDDLEFYRYRRAWNHQIRDAFGFDVRVSGPRPVAPTLIVSNHCGFADINVLTCEIPAEAMPNYISKKEIGDLPIFGWHMAPYGDVLFDRKNPDARRQVVTDALARLERGFSIVLFPEGTRAKDGVPKREIRPAMVEAAIARGITIQPVAVTGTNQIIEDPRRLPARGHRIGVRFGEPKRDWKSAQEVWACVLRMWDELMHSP